MRLWGKPLGPENALVPKASGDQRAAPPMKHLAECQYTCIPECIVNSIQRQVHPIVRGTASASCEFGAKSSVSVRDGFVFLHGMSRDPDNGCEELIPQAKKYRQNEGSRGQCCPQAAAQCCSTKAKRNGRKHWFWKPEGSP
jgi:hypothetical protein